MITDDERKRLKILIDDPKDRSGTYQANGIYWDWLKSTLRQEVQESAKIELILDAHKQAINFGVIDESLIENDNTLKDVEFICADFEESLEGQYYFTDWLQKKFGEILKVKEIEHTEEEIEKLSDKKLKIESLIQKLQSDRADVLMRGIRNPDAQKVSRLNQRDDELILSLVRKASIASGYNMNPEERREHLEKEERLNSLTVQAESIHSEIERDADHTKAKKYSLTIELSISKIIETNNLLAKAEKKLESLRELVEKISVGELENRMEEELEYVKGLVKLSSNRLKTEAISVLHGNTQIITFDVINKWLRLIEEFDSKLYHNHKVAYIGKPAIVIVPGKGNGMYDWKNNALIIPVMPYTNPELSIITAIVEYRIDMDEDKSLFNGFTAIKGNEGIKSTMDFRACFTKEYIVWMTKEYNGYKVMAKEVRAWFEHEIGPNKLHIIIPARFAVPPMSSKDYLEKIRLLDEHVKLHGTEADPDVIYERAIAFCEEESWLAAIELFNQLKIRMVEESSVLFNLGFLYAKIKEYREAVKYYTDFIKANPSSWWSGVAKDTVMKLR